ncbi:MAG: DNA adenine methylase [Acidobacteriota bacterium]
MSPQKHPAARTSGRPPGEPAPGIEVTARPPLKWAGGKRWQVPHLLPLWSPHRARRLVEPFCGGLAVALGLMPGRALLNDVNPHLINFYRQVKRGLVITIPMENSRRLYYEHRKRFNRLLASGRTAGVEAASLFYYLNRTCFNGLCRFNRSGLFNVPFGRYETIRYRVDFSPYRRIFARWSFTAVDIEAIPLRPSDFVYADPPYDVEFTQYASGGFGWEDQVRAARRLAGHAGPVVLANQATSRIVKLYKALGFRVVFLTGPRRISRTGDRTPVREVLALKNL